MSLLACVGKILCGCLLRSLHSRGFTLLKLVQGESHVSGYENCNKLTYNRRKFRSQTSDNMQRWKSRGGKSQGGEVKKWEIRDGESRREKMQVREKVGKSRFTVYFPVIWGSGGSKSNLAKAAGAEPAGQMKDEKLRAVVAGSTFPSQNVQNTSRSDHFWKLQCEKVRVVARNLKGRVLLQRLPPTGPGPHFLDVDADSKLRKRRFLRRQLGARPLASMYLHT